MKTKKYFIFFLAMLCNVLFLIPFIVSWILIFLLVFLGISGILSGCFLILSYLATFQVNIVPISFYEHALLLFAYSLFFMGMGGLLLIGVSLSLSWFLTTIKRYYQWNKNLLGGNADEK